MVIMMIHMTQKIFGLVTWPQIALACVCVLIVFFIDEILVLKKNILLQNIYFKILENQKEGF